jgi:hypothetical protein
MATRIHPQPGEFRLGRRQQDKEHEARRALRGSRDDLLQSKTPFRGKDRRPPTMNGEGWFLAIAIRDVLWPSSSPAEVSATRPFSRLSFTSTWTITEDAGKSRGDPSQTGSIRPWYRWKGSAIYKSIRACALRPSPSGRHGGYERKRGKDLSFTHTNLV